MMKMTAQYTPYRDMVSMENDNEHSDWGGNDRGYVQIYEKTVEDRPVPPRNLVVGGLALAFFGAIIGILIGYFAHSNHAECIPNLVVSLNAVRDEDPTIRERILKMVDPARIKKDTQKFSETPHPAGSDADHQLAQGVQQLWHAFGLDKVEIKNYSICFTDPAMLNQIRIVDENLESKFQMDNPKYNDDLKSSSTRSYPFSPYSPSGVAEGHLIYANKASESDLAYLQDVLKLNLSKKIIIARQLDISPIEQVKNLQKYGASGLILYPDQADYHPPVAKASAYPGSLWLPDDGIIQEATWWSGLGDPLTIGYPSRERAYRLPTERDELLSKIPVQPISYKEAVNYLRLLGGAEAPADWQSAGGNFTYHVGPNFTDNPSWKVQLSTHNSYTEKAIYNVIGYIRGKVEPDRYILIGSQRDSTSYGAVDSAAGTAVLIELARVFGTLMRPKKEGGAGWRPRRTIIFCSWGAEELGNIGATEWMEENFKLLREQAVAYINADDLVFENTSITATASPLLFHAIFNATREVPSPVEDDEHPGIATVYDVWRNTFPDVRNKSNLLFPEASEDDSFYMDYASMFAMDPDDIKSTKKSLHDVYKHAAMLKKRPKINVRSKKNRNIDFMKQIGVPFVDLAYINDIQITAVNYPLYRTQYDTFHAIEQFMDHSFKIHAAVAQVLGELLRDLADSLFIPFNLIDYAQYLKDQAVLVHSNLTSLAKSESIDFDSSPLDSAILSFTHAAVNFHKSQETADLSDPMTIRRMNDKLLIIERVFLDPLSVRQQIPIQKSKLQDNLHPMLQELLSTASSGGGILYPSNQTEAAKLFEVIYFYLVSACESATTVLEGLV